MKETKASYVSSCCYCQHEGARGQLKGHFPHLLCGDSPISALSQSSGQYYNSYLYFTGPFLAPNLDWINKSVLMRKQTGDHQGRSQVCLPLHEHGSMSQVQSDHGINGWDWMRSNIWPTWTGAPLYLSSNWTVKWAAAPCSSAVDLRPWGQII